VLKAKEIGVFSLDPVATTGFTIEPEIRRL
jgi:hypothetical protein